MKNLVNWPSGLTRFSLLLSLGKNTCRKQVCQHNLNNPKASPCLIRLTCLPEITLKLVLLPLDSNRYSSRFVSKWTGSSVAQIVSVPNRVILGSQGKLSSSLQWSFKVRHLMGAPLWEAEGKGGAIGGGGGRGGGAGGAWRHVDVSLLELAPSSSVLSSSSQRSEKSKALRQRRAAGFRNEPQDWSKSQVSGLSLVWSDSFIGLSGLAVTQRRIRWSLIALLWQTRLLFLFFWEEISPTFHRIR